MKILGIETSCDETAAAVVQDGRLVLSNVVASQIDIHAQYGGVVPEVAARSHIEVILPVIHQAMSEAAVTWEEIDGIAVTHGPGLLGSLLIGTLTARTLATTHQKPLYAVNHVVAHTFANYLYKPNGHNAINTPRPAPQFPMLSLSASGKHSDLLLFQSPLHYQMLGATRDDAAGEAFDKVARMLGLPYPGGPAIGALALKGNENAFQLPVAKLGDSYDFSFSGLKTATLRALQTVVGGNVRTHSSELAGRLSSQQQADMAASFQRVVCETLVNNLVRAQRAFQPASVVIAGGVAANSRLRTEVTRRLPSVLPYAAMEYCTDNAAMVASLGSFMAEAGHNIAPAKLRTDPALAI